MSERPDLQRGVCPVCGAPLVEGAQFCGACGSHVPSPLIPYDAPTSPDGLPAELMPPTVPGISSLATETGLRCTVCGTPNLLGVEHCVACGASLADDPTDAQAEGQEPGANGSHP
jgi:Double zinc ribbon